MADSVTQQHRPVVTAVGSERSEPGNPKPEGTENMDTLQIDERLAKWHAEQAHKRLQALKAIATDDITADVRLDRLLDALVGYEGLRWDGDRLTDEPSHDEHGIDGRAPW
jgi:hypothetical protein